ncbi:hypothetical protein ONE63_000049 [Megalurothrips usitatus]|uniref:THAP-type domain-containing protein n=1 Tax=Megalurothrips usitatus TaxID=439358 RepID=A0AAV7Y264_9NEOP|nr:hypothetical protein ONE63_000049 [Megalurothrips usitatus]
MGGWKCAVVNCGNTRKNPQLRFHRIPLDHRCQAWIDFCGNPALNGLTRKELHSFCVCSGHFRDADYNSARKTSLRHDACPTIEHVAGGVDGAAHVPHAEDDPDDPGPSFSNPDDSRGSLDKHHEDTHPVGTSGVTVPDHDYCPPVATKDHDYDHRVAMQNSEADSAFSDCWGDISMELMADNTMDFSDLSEGDKDKL